MEVALIHYWFITRRGGEKVVESILKLFPDADVYTLFYDKKVFGDSISKHNIYTSKLDNPFLRKHHQKIFPLYPYGIRSLKLKKKYDLIISSESGPAKGIANLYNAPHICYIHTPMRYCWSHMNLYISSLHPVMRPLAKFFLHRLRKWDKTTIQNVDLYITNSINVANRVEKFYNRESQVIYPPIEEDFFEKETPALNKDYYLSFGALVPYKRIDLLVKAFNNNGKKLVIIGDGPEMNRLKKEAKENIEFRGRIENKSKIKEIFSRTKALLFPGEEDFGMIPLEVMASGIPVIAFKKGGALETIKEPKNNNVSEATGLFFEFQNEKSINDTINYFETIQTEFDQKFIINHAEKFIEKEFLSKFSSSIKNLLKAKNVKL